MTIRLGPLLLAMIALVAIVTGLQSVMDEGDRDGSEDPRSVTPSNAVTGQQLLVARSPRSSDSVDDEPLHAEDTRFSTFPSPDAVARMIAQSASSDAQLRAHAISALAKAPKSAAIPVLRDVLNNGELRVDRPLALQALRDLALYQGDDDGVIRSAVREAIYHGDDEVLSLSAQGALEVIEESEMTY